jgi:hypothetical protein
MKRIAVLAGVLAIAVAAPASAGVLPGGGLTTAESTGTPAVAATAHAAAVTGVPRPSGVTPGRGLATAASAGAPDTP